MQGANAALGTAAGNYVSEVSDARGKTLGYSYDALSGNLASVTDAKGQVVSHEYDEMNRIVKTTTTDSVTYPSTPLTVTNEYSYEGDHLSAIAHNGFEYTYAYDNLDRVTEVKASDKLLSRTVYRSDRSDLPERVESGNNTGVKYEYDAFDRVTRVSYSDHNNSYPGTQLFRYDYGANGKVGRKGDGLESSETWYEYDLAERPMRFRQCDTTTGELQYAYEMEYDKDNNLETLKAVDETGATHTHIYSYDSDNRVTSVNYGWWGRTIKTDYAQATDGLGRIQKHTLESYGEPYETAYSYVAGGHGTNSTTPLLAQMQQPGQSFGYTYDDTGNIATETRTRTDASGSPVVSTRTYTYDRLGQLIGVNDPTRNRRMEYVYDAGGNILSKTVKNASTGTVIAAEGNIFEHQSTGWRDVLTKVGTTTLQSYSNGNLKSDGAWMYTWHGGNRLAKLTRLGTTGPATIQYRYDDQGTRVYKNVDGAITRYRLQGDDIAHIAGPDYHMQFFRDGLGRVAMVHYNGTDYFYVYNQQGDVVALLNDSLA